MGKIQRALGEGARERLSSPLREKWERLLAELGSFQQVTVAFSGGVDSSLLLAAAVCVHGDGTLALTARSPSLSERDLMRAVEVSTYLGARHRFVETDELERPAYRANLGERCYHCKAALFEAAGLAKGEAARLQGVAEGQLCYGAIMDDLGDHRPGMRAAEDYQVVAPLISAAIYKSDVRAIARVLELPNWDQPAGACLASRFPDGVEVSEEALERVGRYEARLSLLGLVTLRARHHERGLLRLELGAEELQRCFSEPALREEITVAAKALGFRFVSIDLEGYRSGSGNQAGSPLVSLHEPAHG